MKGIVKSSAGWLFTFLPISVALEHVHVSPAVLSGSATLALVPASRLIVRPT